jgi:RimJ/RimL family protein N-acetyltransferase
MDLQPTLTGALVVLRPTVAGDWDAMYAAASDPLIWTAHPAHDRWKEAEFRAYFAGALESGGGLTILDKASGALIGASRYACHDPERDEIEIGWTFLSRAYWGGAYNRDLKRLMVNHMLQHVGCVIFQVGETNWRSQAAMRKIGGVLRDEVRERGYGADGTVVRQLVFEIRKPLA